MAKSSTPATLAAAIDSVTFEEDDGGSEYYDDDDELVSISTAADEEKQPLLLVAVPKAQEQREEASTGAVADVPPGHYRRGKQTVRSAHVWTAYNTLIRIMFFLAKFAITLAAVNITWWDAKQSNYSGLSWKGGLSLTVLLALWL